MKVQGVATHLVIGFGLLANSMVAAAEADLETMQADLDEQRQEQRVRGLDLRAPQGQRKVSSSGCADIWHRDDWGNWSGARGLHGGIAGPDQMGGGAAHHYDEDHPADENCRGKVRDPKGRVLRRRLHAPVGRGGV
ncbi:hypothetical protein F4778DRAFT_777325 [Xylariomycetidae sp. FL2044]|nr:hypothetical protein F4778DRAFT_777325 [Xylariomycetidae sp. FL2044]